MVVQNFCLLFDSNLFNVLFYTHSGEHLNDLDGAINHFQQCFAFSLTFITLHTQGTPTTPYFLTVILFQTSLDPKN